MSELYLGLMSGTSADGIDAALVDFSDTHPTLIATHYNPFPTELRQKIIALCTPGLDEINRLSELDILLGKEFALAVNTLLKTHNIEKNQIRAIGSHGQTIRHHPQKRFTLQIGDPNIIAAETGITTISDFRRRDMAMGGQGAPLVPAFHHAIFSKSDTHRAIVNIGGIANITLLSDTTSGFDTGPGNTLLDTWIEKHRGERFDKNGEWAKQGCANSPLLKKLLTDPYFSLPAPKSTGREYFNLSWLESHLANTLLSPVDIQTTLVELTAYSIMDAIKKHFSHGEIFVCGGGAHNHYLMSRLQTLATNFSVDSTKKLGVNPNWVEAMAFAWLAKQTLEKKSGNIPAVTGARQPSILGGIYS